MRYAPNPWYRNNHINRLYQESGNHHKAHAVISDNLDTYDQNSYQSKAKGFRMSASGASADKYGKLGSNSATGLKKNFKAGGSKTLAGFMSEDQLRFHRGYDELKNYCQKAILWAHYVPEVTQERKLSLLKITQTEYDRLLNLALKAVARKIEGIDAEAQIKPETDLKQTSQRPITPLWPSRIFSYVHKVAINHSGSTPFPISLDKKGHYNSKSPFVEGPIDSNMYCLRPDGELYAVVPTPEWMRLRRKGSLMTA